MNHETLTKYAELLISMSTAYILNEIDAETYKANIDIINIIINDKLKNKKLTT